MSDYETVNCENYYTPPLKLKKDSKAKKIAKISALIPFVIFDGCAWVHGIPTVSSVIMGHLLFGEGPMMM